MKKLIQVLIVSGLILVMGGTAQGHGTIQQSKFKRNHEKDIMLYAHITDFEHKHDNGDLHKADKNYKFKKSAEQLKQEMLAAEKERLAAEKLKKEILAADDPLQIGIDAYSKKDFKTAYKVFKELAQQGNLDAKNNLGIMLIQKEGIPEGMTKVERLSMAKELFYTVGKSGLVAAQQNYHQVNGQLLQLEELKRITQQQRKIAQENQSRVREEKRRAQIEEKRIRERKEEQRKKDEEERLAKEEKEKVAYQKELAEQGDKQAQFNLGVYYYKGKGVPQDYEEAVKWYRLAAEQDNTNAMNSLGEMYLQGKGVPQDNVVALMWFNLCSKWNKLCMENENLVKKKMTPSQIEKALAATKVEQKRLSEQKRLANERAKQKRLANEKAFQQRQKEKYNLAMKLQAAGQTCIASISEPLYKRSVLDIQKKLFAAIKQINNTGRYTGSDLDGLMISYYRQIISIGSNDRSANCHE